MRRLLTFVTFGLTAAIGVVVAGGDVADAGASKTCTLNYLCVSKRYNAPRSTDTSMKYGWKDYSGNNFYGRNKQNRSEVDLTTQRYSSGGGKVSSWVGSIRNRDNIYTFRMCIGKYDPGVRDRIASHGANFFGETWKPVATDAGVVWQTKDYRCN